MPTSDELFDKTEFERLMSLYTCAIMEIETKFNVLNVQFSAAQQYNPIDTIKTRLKSPDSIIEKLERRNLPLTLESIEGNLNDIAGVRVICPFEEDIFALADMLLLQDDISLVELQAIQREYGISVDALMAKAAQLNIITNNRYTSYYQKKNALPAFKEAVEASHYPMEHTNRFERLVYRALASEVISTSKAAALLDISVNEVRNNLNLM